jgi:GT2 family glycosyltransferase
VMSTLPVTAAIVNFRTPDLTRRALSSFTSAYPEVRVILIDNGSGGENGDLIESVRSGYPDVEVVINQRNIHHGPAMHQGMGLVSTPFALFLDSDCIVLRPGFIELMVAGLVAEKNRYAAGSLQYVNKRGFPVKREARGAVPYINPYCMLIKKELYHLLPPFALHGSPVLRNIEGARKKNFDLVEVKLDEYVRHDFRGTAGRFGYRLGIRGRMNFLLNKLGL